MIKNLKVLLFVFSILSTAASKSSKKINYSKPALEKNKLFSKGVLIDFNKEFEKYAAKANKKFLHLADALLENDLAVLENISEGNSKTQGEAMGWLRGLVGEVRFSSSFLSPESSMDVQSDINYDTKERKEFYSSLKWTVNLFRGGADVFKYLSIKNSVKSTVYESIGFIADRMVKIQSLYYEKSLIDQTLDHLKQVESLYEKLYQEIVIKEKHGLENTKDIINLKSSYNDIKLKIYKNTIDKAGKEAQLYNLIGDYNEKGFDEDPQLIFDSEEELANFMYSYDTNLILLRCRVDMLDSAISANKSNRFSPNVNLSCGIASTGNFLDKHPIKKGLESELFDYNYKYDTSGDNLNIKPMYNITMDYSLTNLFLGKDVSLYNRRKVEKKKLLKYTHDIPVKAKSLFVKYNQELKALKKIIQMKKDMQKLFDRNQKLYQSGAIKLNEFNDTLAGLNAVKEQELRKKFSYNIAILELNKYIIYNLKPIKNKINKLISSI